MSHLQVNDITVILLSLAVLLAAARLLGEIMQKFGQPPVIGEILAGVLLGQTVLGRVWPQAMTFLFPDTGAAPTVLEGIRTVAVVLFLLVAGMEVDLSSMFRQGRTAVTVSIAGVVAPFALGLLAAALAPTFLGRQEHIQTPIFVLFFATAMSISALPVIAKTLMDLSLYRTDFGMVVIAAAIFDDLFGWIIFAVVLSLMNPGNGHLWIGGTIGLTAVFTVFMLTVGRWVIHAVLPWIQARTSWPGGVLGFAAVLALAGAAFTEWIGIHAVFGSFLVGVALGDSEHLRERTRATLEQFVSFIFAPLFFASIGLRVDFIANFDVLLVLAVLLIACASKVVGCGLGARWAGMPAREAWAIGFAMNSRGAMEIILGTLAWQLGVIDDRLFVALVVMALVTSMLSGTMMQMILRRPLPKRFADYLHQRGFINPLQSTDRESAVRELAQTAASITGLKPEAIVSAVLQRERLMPTGLGLCVAVPHARLHGLTKPVVCVGISREGIEFDAPDGEPSRMIFMILTPSDDSSGQLEILADISRTFLNQAMRERGLRVGSFNEFLAVLRTRETGTMATRGRLSDPMTVILAHTGIQRRQRPNERSGFMAALSYNVLMKRRFRKRALLMILLLLTGGPIMNVAVALGFAVWEPQKSSNPADVTDRAPAIFARHGFKLESDESLAGYQGKGIGLTFTSAIVEVEPTRFFVLTESGWPSRGLGGVVSVVAPLNNSNMVSIHHALELSPKIRPRNPLLPLPYVLPLRPIWPGFAINTIFYAAILWLLFAAPGFMRRRIRVGRGRCPACAYPVGSSEICTECGRPVRVQR